MLRMMVQKKKKMMTRYEMITSFEGPDSQLGSRWGIYWYCSHIYHCGDPEGSYPASYNLMYVESHYLASKVLEVYPNLSICFFLAAILINLVTQLLKKFETKYGIYQFISSPMCMAIPFYLGGYFVIDMCLGSLVLFGWQMYNKHKAKDFGPRLAGL